MARVKGGGVVLRNAPKSYKAKDSAYAVGGKGGFIVALRPGKYPKTPQQRKIGDAARACGIKSGISKKALQEAMRDCIPKQFGKRTG